MRFVHSDQLLLCLPDWILWKPLSVLQRVHQQPMSQWRRLLVYSKLAQLLPVRVPKWILWPKLSILLDSDYDYSFAACKLELCRLKRQLLLHSQSKRLL